MFNEILKDSCLSNNCASSSQYKFAFDCYVTIHLNKNFTLDGASTVTNTTKEHKEDKESYLPFTFLFNNKPIPNPSQNKRKKKIILTKKGDKG